MTPLSEHFSYAEGVRSDTAARERIDNTPGKQELWNMTEAAAQLEKVRALLGVPLHVSSWFRSHELNTAIGGSQKPQGHSSGYCIDFEAPQFGDPFAVCKRILESGIQFDQLIYEGTWTHIGFHPDMRRQVMTAKFHPGLPTTYQEGIVR